MTHIDGRLKDERARLDRSERFVCGRYDSELDMRSRADIPTSTATIANTASDILETLKLAYLSQQFRLAEGFVVEHIAELLDYVQTGLDHEEEGRDV